MQKIKLKTEESGKKLLAAYAPPKWSETADDDDDVAQQKQTVCIFTKMLMCLVVSTIITIKKICLKIICCSFSLILARTF